jgi:AcrR family transcriptional regulator
MGKYRRNALTFGAAPEDGANEGRAPLARYADDEGLPEVLREIARVAVHQELNQETLAKRLGVNSAAVLRHFRTKKNKGGPREQTIRNYAMALGLRPEYLLLVHSGKFEDANAKEAGHPNPARVSEGYWINEIRLAFERPLQWKNGTGEIVASYLRSLAETERRRYLGIFAIEWYRKNSSEESVAATYYALDAFVASAPPDLNLAQYRREFVAGEDRFVKLWEAVRPVFEVEEFDIIMALVRHLHQKLNIDIAPMESALSDAYFYTAWREGRYKKEHWQ